MTKSVVKSTMFVEKIVSEQRKSEQVITVFKCSEKRGVRSNDNYKKIK